MMKRKVFAAVMTAGMAMGNIQPALAYTSKIFPCPEFTPSIATLTLKEDGAVVTDCITLKDADGNEISQTTASRILKRMVADSLIYQDGSGRKTKYKKR